MPKPTPSELQAFVAATEDALNDLAVLAFEEPDRLIVSNGRGEQQPHQMLLSRLVELVHDENETPRFKPNGVKLFVSPVDTEEEVPA